MRVLLIEDDPRVGEVLRLYLETEGFELETAISGEAGLRQLEENPPDLVLLDIRLPGIDGWNVARNIRRQGNTIPFIILTSRAEEPDRIQGFKLGADDYVAKPFSPRELVARIKAVLNRVKAGSLSAEQEILHYRGITINPGNRSVACDNQPVDLTRREFDLLWKLASYPGRVFGRDQLYESVWGDESFGDLHTLEVHINRLRNKIEREHGPRYLITVRGVGYKFEVTEND